MLPATTPSTSAPAIEREIDAAAAEDARRTTRMVLPFLLLGLYFVDCALGKVSAQPDVRKALLVEVVVCFVRWAVLAMLAPPTKRETQAVSRMRHVVNAASSWLVSAGMANIYLTAGPRTTSIQLLELGLVATGICTLAMMSMSSTVVTYLGYVLINYGALALTMLAYGDDAILPLAPIMMGLFGAALVFIALRNRAAQRAKARLTIDLREAGLRDVLTGLRNRAFGVAFAEQRAMQVLERWKENGPPPRAAGPTLAFFLIDLDHFKQVNDRHGHSAGDEVLASFAKVARGALRANDVVVRWGGEEFLVIIEVSGREAASAAAERLRDTFATNTISLAAGGSVSVTCSVGACLFPRDPAFPDGVTWQATVALADDALYRAKHAGRNRVVWDEAEHEGAAFVSPATSASRMM